MSVKIFSWHRAPLKALFARRDKLPHAMLVQGHAGIGKVEFARVAAQSLLCEAPEDDFACGTCAACGWFAEGNHPDYREILPESLKADDSEAEAAGDSDKAEKKSAQITIDQVRDLRQFVSLSTHRDGFRVLLIHPAEAMNPAAANALLKTLEEPTPRTLILLVADQPGRLLATVKSRCQALVLQPPEKAEAVAWLKEQGVNDADVLLAQAGGAPLLALEWADEGYQSQRKQFLDALGELKRSDWLSVAGAFEKSDLTQVVHWLQTWCCDLITMKQIGEARHHPDYESAIKRVAADAPLAPLFRYESALRQSRRTIQHPLNARLLLEQLLISYAQAVEP
jgi:DNA polymerase III subunit delta'